MTDRDRLIELIHKADVNDSYECELCEKDDSACLLCQAAKIADYLLANGVIVPPCKIGQKVYDISELISGTYAPEMYVLQGNELYIEKNKVGEYIYTYDGMYIYPEDMGRSIFLTKEEAEEKLRELNK